MKYYRKQICLFFLSLIVFFANPALAQDATSNQPAVQEDSTKLSNKELRKKRYESASPEQKAKMDKRKEILKNLSKEQRELLKQENERHRQEVKKITGYDPSEI